MDGWMDGWTGWVQALALQARPLQANLYSHSAEREDGIRGARVVRGSFIEALCDYSRRVGLACGVAKIPRLLVC
jgi:hypothetical protein